MRALLIVMLTAGAATAAPTVTFTGNDAFSEAELRAAMPSVEDQEELERSLLYLSMFYWDRGYATVKIADAPWAKSHIAIAIDEGPRFTMGAVRVKDHEELLDKLAVRPGAPFSRTRLAEDRERLAVYFEDQGYAFANIIPITKLDLATATIDLTFEIERGTRARFGAIRVEHAPVDVIRRELGLAEGEVYSATKLEAARRRIVARGFSRVTIATQHGAKDDLVDLTIEAWPD